ncbi:S8 family serine peptidase [Mucilaginibacter sp. McL0603]|uniref:S8 family serine peptidase n=1 Tax=Mucilaginibacter sp. McL0603 TaxID=3415670 RepID=UPI003CF092D7
MGINEKKSDYVAPSFAIKCKPDYTHLEKTYRKNQLIVTFKDFPSEEQINTVKGYFKEMGFENITIKKCQDCNMPVQLWLAEGIETVIVDKGIKVGSGGGTGTVGESYSLNFLSNIPPHELKNIGKFKPDYNKGTEEVVIAVLDTGFDPYIVDEGYIYKGNISKKEYECFNGTEYGWNFVENNKDIEDDNAGRHGSLVTQFIINEFKNSKKTVKIIPVKTHDRNGHGDLFAIFCAIYYAIAKGAQIINASWGFYSYEREPLFPPLKTIIERLEEEGVLLVAAAGNQTDADDRIASKIFLENTGREPKPEDLRDLAIHHFLPAYFSSGEDNLITVTTTDGKEVASTENFSNVYVDLGIIADKKIKDDLWFEVPFEQTGEPGHVRGSSFATAIATGIIGAYSESSNFKKGSVDKQKIFEDLKPISNIGLNPRVQPNPPEPIAEFIKNGLCIKKQG